jgi:hypothetical protein
MTTPKFGPYNLPSSNLIERFVTEHLYDTKYILSIEELPQADKIFPASSGGGVNNTDWLGIALCNYLITLDVEFLNWIITRIITLNNQRTYVGGERTEYHWDNAHSQEATSMLWSLILLKDAIDENWIIMARNLIIDRLIGNPRTIDDGLWDTNPRIISKLFRFEACVEILKKKLIKHSVFTKQEINNALRRARSHMQHISSLKYDILIKKWENGWGVYPDGTPFWGTYSNRSVRPEVTLKYWEAAGQGVPAFQIGYNFADGLRWITNASFGLSASGLRLWWTMRKRIKDLAKWWWNKIYYDCDTIEHRGYPPAEHQVPIWDADGIHQPISNPKCQTDHGKLEKWYPCTNLAVGKWKLHGLRSIDAQYKYYGVQALYHPEVLDYIYRFYGA